MDYQLEYVRLAYSVAALAMLFLGLMLGRLSVKKSRVVRKLELEALQAYRATQVGQHEVVLAELDSMITSRKHDLDN